MTIYCSNRYSDYFSDTHNGNYYYNYYLYYSDAYSDFSIINNQYYIYSYWCYYPYSYLPNQDNYPPILSNFFSPTCLFTNTNFDVSFVVNEDARVTLSFNNSDYVSDFATGNCQFTSIQSPDDVGYYSYSVVAIPVSNSSVADVISETIPVVSPNATMQSYNHCPVQSVNVIAKNGMVISDFCSKDGTILYISDGQFKNLYSDPQTNTTNASDVFYQYAWYSYTCGFTVVRQQNGDIFLTNNGDINIASAIHLVSDVLGRSDTTSLQNITIFSNLGNININQDIFISGRITCMASQGTIFVAAGVTLQSTKDQVVMMGSDLINNGSIKNAIPGLANLSDSPSSATWTISNLSDNLSGSGITNVSDHITINSNKNIIITNDAVLSKNLTINTSGTVTVSSITSPGHNININGQCIIISDAINVSVDQQDRIAGGISLQSKTDIIGGMFSNNFGHIDLIAGCNITTPTITENTSGSNGNTGTYSCDNRGSDGNANNSQVNIALIAGFNITKPTITINTNYGNGGNGGQTGGDGGDGGASNVQASIALIAGCDIITPTITVSTSSGSGGDGDDSEQGDGGNGGSNNVQVSIALIVGCNIMMPTITANVRGGFAGDGDDSGGDGGNGGNSNVQISIALMAGCNITESTIPENSTGEGRDGDDGDGNTQVYIMLKAYGSTANEGYTASLYHMRNMGLNITATAPNIFSGSDVTLTITAQNMGFIEESDNTIVITANGQYVSDGHPYDYSSDQLPTYPLSLASLSPGQSDVFTVTTHLPAGKFTFTAATRDFPFSSDSAYVNVSGTSTITSLSWHLSGSFLYLIFDLPLTFTTTYPNTSDYRTILSDMYCCAESVPFTVGLMISDQSDMFSDNASILNGRQSVIVSASDGNLFMTSTAGLFVFELANIVSDSIGIFYSDTYGQLNKIMSDAGGQIATMVITQEATNLEITSIIPSDTFVKLGSSLAFFATIKNYGPVDVSDAFVSVTTNFGDQFTQNIGFIASDGMSNLLIPYTPGQTGDYNFNFSIDSHQVINTNPSDCIMSVSVFDLDLAITKISPNQVIPQFPYSVSFNLTKIGTCPGKVHITATVASDQILYESDYTDSGNYTIVLMALSDQTNFALKLGASCGVYSDINDYYPVQFLTLTDALQVYGITADPSSSDFMSDVESALLCYGISDLNVYLQSDVLSMARTALEKVGISDLNAPFSFKGMTFSDFRTLWNFETIVSYRSVLASLNLINASESSLNIKGYGSLLDFSLFLNQDILYYLSLHYNLGLPTSDIGKAFTGICSYLSTNNISTIPATLSINQYSDFFINSDAMILRNSDQSVNLSCSDNRFCMTASDGSFFLCLSPFTSDYPTFTYSDTTQFISKIMKLGGDFNTHLGSAKDNLVTSLTFLPAGISTGTVIGKFLLFMMFLIVVGLLFIPHPSAMQYMPWDEKDS